MKKTTASATKTPHLFALSGLKFCTVLGILFCHTGLIPMFDACARMVEVLFVLSGFLVAYNHFESTTDYTLIKGIQYIKHKLFSFYPIHVFTFLLQAIFVAYWAEKPLSYLLSVGTLNLALAHAWFIETEFSYNGVSWFLSALLFAYLITPCIAGIIKHLGTNVKGLLTFATIVIATRILVEYLNRYHYVKIDLHCNPFVQSLNYLMGYLTGIIFLKKATLNQYLKANTSILVLSLLQILYLVFYFLCCYRFNNAPRYIFVILALPLIYFCAFSKGIVAKFLSLKSFQKLSNITLELFMLHSFILYKFPTDSGSLKSYVVFFSLSFAAALAFHVISQKIHKLK